LAKTFGGQAEAQAKTFGGKIAILKNQFGEFLEEIGNVITRNPAVVKAIGLMADAFARMAQWVANNRQWLIDMSNAIVVYVIRAIRDFVEGIRAVHISWLYMKAGAQYAIAWIYEALANMVTWMRDTILAPFDMLAKKLVDLGWIDVNPFDSITLGLQKLELKHLKTTISILDDITKVNKEYTALSNKLEGAALKIEALKGVQMQVKDAVVTGATEIAESLNYTAITFEELYQKMIGWSDRATTVTVANEQIMARAAQVRSNLMQSAYKAMENQLMRFIELHKFSVGEFAKAVLQTVKIELIGIAARASVWALFELAMGLANAAMGNAASAALHFAAAGQFAAIAGATAAAAAAVNVLSGPGAQQPEQGASPSNPTYVSGTTEPSSQTSGTTNITHVEVKVYNPLSNQNWDEVFELDIAPALKRAQDRGVI
jgi:hypothetical protein